MAAELTAPFPYFGGKAHYAADVWARLGDVTDYIEPFAGSAAVLLRRPDAHAWWDRTETVNDADGLLCNVWRAIQHDPAAVARAADWPVNECDLTARHLWLVGERDRLTERLMTDPDWYDARAAGWWVWGASCWIGSGWCSGQGPWQVVDGALTRMETDSGVNRQLPHLGNSGRGVNRQLPHLGDSGQGVNRQLPHLGDSGRGVNRQLPHLDDSGRGHAAAWAAHLETLMARLSDRLRRVRVACGDWSRVVTPGVREASSRHGPIGVFLDPPYAITGERAGRLYAIDGGDAVADDALAWCQAHQAVPGLRLALAGYYAADDLPGWTPVTGRRRQRGAGYGNLGNNRARDNFARDTVWFSPACLAGNAPQLTLWAEASD